MKSFDPRMQLLFAMLFADADAQRRRARNRAASRPQSTPIRPSKPLSEPQLAQLEVERCYTGAVALGFFGVIFAFVTLAVVGDVLGQNTGVTTLLFPLICCAGCSLSAIALYRRGSHARALLERIAADARTARWRTMHRTQGSTVTDAQRVAQLRARYERGEVRGRDAPIALAADETCFHVCDCAATDPGRGVLGAIGRGQLVITDKRAAIVGPDRAFIVLLSDVLRFTAMDDRRVRIQSTTRTAAIDVELAYPLETVAYLLIACKAAGITPARPAA